MAGRMLVQEKCPSGGGQWGLAQDDYGKIWWSNAGGEKGLWHFQTPIIYGGYDVAGAVSAGLHGSVAAASASPITRAARCGCAPRTRR